MPYQSQPLFEDAIFTGTLTALNEVVALSLSNSSGAIVNISGTWTGTILFDGSNDDFVTFQNAAVFTPPAGVITAGVTANGYYRFVAVAGFTKIRARMSSYTSGSATVVLSASIGSGLAPTVSINYDSMLGTSKLTGNTDGTKIGNVGDRLKVDAQVTVTSPGVSAFTEKLRYNDMNDTTGGVVRGTTITEAAGWVKVYSYNGSGVYTGMTLGIATANAKWFIRLVLNSTEELFGSNGVLTDDVDGPYGLAVGTQNTITTGINWGTNASFFYHSSPTYNPIRFSSKVEVYVKRKTGGGSKVFNAGLIVHTKET